MNHGISDRSRLLELPEDSTAEIRFERTGDKVRVYASFKLPQSSGSGGSWWQRCYEHGCLGEALVRGGACIAHTDKSARAAYISQVIHSGAPLSFRGAQVSQQLWDEVLASPAFVQGAPCVPIDFAGSEINAEIKFTGVEFKYGLTFFGASFFAAVDMRKCTFREFFDVRHGYVKVRPINLGESTFCSGVDISYLKAEQSVAFDGAKFSSTLTADGTDATIHLSGATVSGNASFKSSKAWLLLNGCTLDGLFDLSNASLIALSAEQLMVSGAPRLGPCSIKNVHLARSTFAARIYMEVVADEVDLTGAILKQGGLIVLDKAKLNLRQVKLGGPLRVSGKMQGTTMPEIVSLLNADAGRMSFARVSLSRCSLDGAHGLGSVDIESTVRFPECPWWAARRHYLADEWAWRAAHPSILNFGWKLAGVRIGSESERPLQGAESMIWLPSLPASQISATYRELRRSLESKSDMPGASDFYYGEMEMRRHDGDAGFWERVLVTLYWLLSGYGLRAGRCVIAYGVLVCLATWAMKFDGFTGDNYSITRAAIFSVRASLPGITTVEQLSPFGQTIEIALRVLGTLTIALFLISVRSRLMRKPSE